jgi:hypothetical protein
MRRADSWFVLVALNFACTKAPAQETHTQNVANTVAVAAPEVVSVPTVAVDVPIVPTVAVPVREEPVDPRIVRLRALASNTTPLAEAVDAAHGVLVVRYLEAPPSGQGGERISNQHLCGTALTRQLAALQRDLAAVVAQANTNDSLQCDNQGCNVAGMEYQPAWHIQFVTVGTSLQLESIVQVSHGAMSEAWNTRADAYISRSLATARTHPCPVQR